MESPTGATPAGPLDAAAQTANQAVRAFSNTTGKISPDATTADAGSALLTIAASLDYLAAATRHILDGQEAATRYEKQYMASRFVFFFFFFFFVHVLRRLVLLGWGSAAPER